MTKRADQLNTARLHLGGLGAARDSMNRRALVGSGLEGMMANEPVTVIVAGLVDAGGDHRDRVRVGG